MKLCLLIKGASLVSKWRPLQRSQRTQCREKVIVECKAPMDTSKTVHAPKTKETWGKKEPNDSESQRTREYVVRHCLPGKAA